MFEWLDFFDSNFLTSGTMNGATDNTVSSFTDDFADFVLAADTEADGRFGFFVTRNGLGGSDGGFGVRSGSVGNGRGVVDGLA